MSTSTTPPRQDRDLDTSLAAMPMVHGKLPSWALWATFAAAAVLCLGIGWLLAGLNLVVAVVLTIVAFAALTYAWSRSVEGVRKATDRLVTAVVSSFFVIALIPLVSVVVTVLNNGLARFDAEFFTFSMRGIVGEGGGAYHAIAGTLVITALATVISVPVGLLAAIYLVEYGRGRLAKAITFFVDVMTGIPSIVAGLFAYALFRIFLGPGVRIGLAGAVALAVLMIPVVVRSTEEILKLVPNELREAAYALGVPRWRTIVKVVLPTALAGIATGITLSIARVIGETAPLLITLGATTGVNLNPFVEGRMAALPVFAYYSYATPGIPRDAYTDRAWTAALVLIIIVMALNLAARLISRFFAPKTGR